MSQIVIKGVETTEEQEAAYDLICKVHYPGYYGFRSTIDTFLANYPEYRREHTRIAVVDGQIVACLCIFTHTSRLGESRMKMGGIGNVTTVGPWRRKGIAALMMSEAMRYMKTRGYHLAMLFGIADFYHRWGFASALPEYASVIDCREADIATDTNCKQRLLKPSDIALLVKIHDKNDEETACSLIRTSGHYTARWDRWKDAHVLTTDQGKIVAYYLGKPSGNELRIEELSALDYSWHEPLLKMCVKHALREYASQIRFLLPPSHPFIKFLMRYRTDHEMHIYRNANGMMALVNLEETLECMAAEWESLLVRHGMVKEDAEITLIIDKAPFRLHIHRGSVAVVPGHGKNKLAFSSTEFIQILTGYRFHDELLSAKRRSIDPMGRRLFASLFPKRTPYVWLPDRF